MFASRQHCWQLYIIHPYRQPSLPISDVLFKHKMFWGYTPVPVATRSKAWVCSRSPAEIVGSNPTGGMDVCCECCQVEVSATG